uniref:Uncharacterized protein n=1 Tax=Oryzias latipes TaxID=8090 RepID=A0A3B3I6D2_ORYLA
SSQILCKNICLAYFIAFGSFSILKLGFSFQEVKEAAESPYNSIYQKKKKNEPGDMKKSLPVLCLKFCCRCLTADLKPFSSYKWRTRCLSRFCTQ